MTANKGFSLIEILIALTIIGIMAAGVLGLTKWIGKAKISKTRTTIANVKLAIDSYANDTGAYPSTLSELATRPADEKIAKRWQGPYESAEVEDGWKTPFVYQLNAKGSKNKYELYSWGPNGEGSPENEWISVWDIA